MEEKVFVNIFHFFLYVPTSLEKIDSFFYYYQSNHIKVPKKRTFQCLYLYSYIVHTYFLLELYYSFKQFLSHRDIVLSTFLLNQINQKFNTLLSF